MVRFFSPLSTLRVLIFKDLVNLVPSVVNSRKIIKMKPILTFLFSAIISLAYGQNDTLSFPQSWEGKWVGTLEIHNASGLAQALPMELHLLPMDSVGQWSWTIIYGEDKDTGKRPYELHTINAEKGLYLIDEKNSIKMEAYYLGGKFFQWFEVQGSLLLTSTQLVGEELHWEIVFGKSEPASVTGDQAIDGEEIPAVKTFPVHGMQRAVLRRE